jgi:integrase
MPRKAQWPPPIYPLRAKPGQRTFCRVWSGGESRDVPLGPAGSPGAKGRYAEVCAQLSSAGVVLDRRRDLTVTELADWWQGYAARGYRPTSREPVQFRYPLAELVARHGPEPAASFSPRKLRDLRLHFGTLWARKVVNRQINRLRTVFRCAVEEELVPGTVHAALRAVRPVPPNTPGFRETPPARAVREADVRAALPLLPPAPRAMLELQWLTGMRSGEVRVLRTADVERRAPDLWVYRPGQHKNLWRGHRRDVPLGPAAVAVLSPWLLPGDPGAFVFSPRRSLAMQGRAGRTRPVGEAGRRRGDCYEQSSYTRAVRRACRKAGVDFHPYLCRHAYKKRGLAAGNQLAVQSAMGQRSATAFDGYDGLDLDAACELARRIG